MGAAADVGPKISSPPLPTAQRCASRSLLGEACLQVAAEVLSWRHRVLKDCEVGHVVEAQGQLGQRQVQLVHAEWGQTLSASPRPHGAVPITTVAVSHHTRTPRLAPNTPCSRPCAPTALRSHSPPTQPRSHLVVTLLSFLWLSAPGLPRSGSPFLDGCFRVFLLRALLTVEAQCLGSSWWPQAEGYDRRETATPKVELGTPHLSHTASGVPRLWRTWTETPEATEALTRSLRLCCSAQASMMQTQACRAISSRNLLHSPNAVAWSWGCCKGKPTALS